MIFIFEQQSHFNMESDPKYLGVPAYLDANLIYKALNLLSTEKLKEVSEVQFLATEEIDICNYKQVFKNYLADINYYRFDEDLVWEISDSFPDIDELSVPSQKICIESLIKNINVHTVFSSKEQKNYIKYLQNNEDVCLFFLPYCKSFSFKLLEDLQTHKTNLFSDIKFLKGRSRKEHIFIEVDELLKIRHELANVSPIIKVQRKWSNYIIEEFIGIFGDEFFEKIIKYLGSSKRKYHVFGKDIFIARRIIEKLLNNTDRHYYYLPEDRDDIKVSNKSVVVYNLERLEHSDDFKDLADMMNKMDKVYNVLQALRKIDIQYFWDFENLELPSTENYRDFITRIFLGLLLESGVYDRENMRKLGSFKDNILKNLIPCPESLEILYGAIKNFSNVKYDDLTDNAGFWYYLKTLTEKKSVNENDKKSEFVQEEPITFEKTDLGWKITGLKIKHPTDARGILFLCIIIKYSQIMKERNEPVYSIDSKKVLKIASEYLEKDYDLDESKIRDRTVEEYARSTVSGRIADAKDRKPLLDKFIVEHIDLNSKENNYFYEINKKNKRSRIEVNVIDPKLDEILAEY